MTKEEAYQKLLESGKEVIKLQLERVDHAWEHIAVEGNVSRAKFYFQSFEDDFERWWIRADDQHLIDVIDQVQYAVLRIDLFNHLASMAASAKWNIFPETGSLAVMIWGAR